MMKSNHSCFSVLFSFLLILTACTTGAIDGFADGKVFVWFDENANGIVDGNERPLSRVLVGIGYPNTFTDENGQASVSEFAPGCGKDCWRGKSIHAQIPQGFKATTPTEVPLIGYGKTYQFGFALDPMSATATPYAASLSCKRYPNVEADAMAVAPDGSLWVVAMDHIARYSSQEDRFVSYDAPSDLYDSIAVASNNDVWVTFQESSAGRYHDSKWTTYPADSLVTGSDLSIGTTLDGQVWFAIQAPPDKLASFNPATGQWRFYVQSSDVGYVVGEKVRALTNSSMWFAAFDDRAELTPPASDANIQWRVYDIHTFTADEVVQIPDVNWIEDSQMAADGTLWLATTNGLAQFDTATNNWNIRDWPRSEELSPVIDTSSLAISLDGSVWVGTSSNGKPLALQFIPDSNQGIWHTYDEREGIPDIEGIAITPDGRIWFNPGSTAEMIVVCTLLK